MQFRVLGPVELVMNAQPIPIGHPRQRSVLAALLAEPNRPVLSEQLIDRVWGDDPPANARNLLSGYITRLRGVINTIDVDGRVGLGRRSGGYGINVDPALVDMHLFRGLVERARDTHEAEAGRLLTEALDLWRGPAFADMTSPWFAYVRQTLDQERMNTLLRRNEIALHEGQQAELVGDLYQLAAAHPLDERVIGQLMQALCLSGRQADALAVFADARSRFAEELGLDPGPELRTLEQRILHNDLNPGPRTQPGTMAVPSSARQTAVPQQLPAGTADFTGRDSDLAELDALLARQVGRDDAGLAVLIVNGTAGVGKTALAVHWARRIRNRFPDGQLFVNLRGHGSKPPVDPLHALTLFLRALGVPAEQVPVSLDEAVALYRTVLADRRVLVLLDDAHGPEQVRPVLPSSPGCAILITSRNRLSGLVAKEGARQFTLGLLSTPAANELVTRIIGEHRTSAEPQAVAELVHLCTRLPLALRIASANLANFPALPIADYVAELRRGNRLDALEVVGDQEAAVRIAFDLSYAGLCADARSLFRRLGLVPGATFTAAVAAALTNGPVDEGAALLKLLGGAHVVEADGDRYRFHDLLRLFAEERVRDDESDSDRTVVLGRLFGYYLTSARRARDLLYAQMLHLPRESDTAESWTEMLDERNAALAWLDAERSNLLAATAHAAERGPRWVAWRLADVLRGYFWLRRCTEEWLDAAGNALRAAEGDNDLLAQASALLSMGDAHWTVANHAGAIEFYRRGLVAAARAGWANGQAAISGNLASVHLERGELELAEENYVKALDMHAQLGRRGAQGISLNNLGNLYWEMGSLRRASDHFTRALALHDESGAVVPKANALLNLGAVQLDLGQIRPALASLRAAITLCQEIGDAADEATALDTAARAYRDSGQYDQALDHVHRALDQAHRIGTRRIEAGALITLGTISHRLGRHLDAVTYHEQALTVCVATGDSRNEVEAMLGRAASRLVLGQSDDALLDARAAHSSAGQHGYRILSGRALTELAHIHLRRREFPDAVESAEQASQTQHDIGDCLWEARSLWVWSLALNQQGDSSTGREYRRRAQALYREIDAIPWPDAWAR